VKKPDIAAMLLFAAVTLAAVTVRAFSLSIVFDRYTGLAEPYHYLTWIMLGLNILAAIYALSIKFDRLSGFIKKPEFIALLAAIILGAAGFLDIISIIEGGATVTQVILAALSLISAVCIMLLAKSSNAGKLTLGFFATMPVFWGTFWFLTMFAKNAANPVVLSYIYDFLAVWFFCICASTFAGFYFGQRKKRLLSFAWGLGLFFAVISGVSPYLAKIIDPAAITLQTGNIAEYMRMLFAALYIGAIPSMAKKAIGMKTDEEELEDVKDSTI
jgi:hypothetical protein